MKYRKKPVVIEAIQYDGKNIVEITEFCPQSHSFYEDSFLISTLEGAMRCNQLDWVIKGVKGEFYPCKPDIFEQTYEKVE